MKKECLAYISLAALAFSSAGGLAQAPQHTLTLAGHKGTAPVIQVNGHAYVDIEALARIANGSIKFQGSSITLTLPEAGAAGPGEEDRNSSSFSKAFLDAAIEEMSVIREWRIVIVNAVQTNYPVTDALVAGYRRNADSRLALASAAVTTEADRKAFPLLQNEFNNMQQLSEKYVDMRNNLQFTPTNSIANDPLDEKILNCAQGLEKLAADGAFTDVAACH